MAYASWRKRPYLLPAINYLWLAFVAFVPQLVAFYLPASRGHLSDNWASVSLVVSQVLLLLFAWTNRKLAGMWLLILGLALNLLVIIANGGYMPISPATAGHLVPAAVVNSMELGSRFGFGKDVLLLPESTHLVWLSDRFLLPEWLGHPVAFSLGDICVAIGIFWLLLRQGIPLKILERFKSK
jgi:hypothetical protein